MLDALPRLRVRCRRTAWDAFYRRGLAAPRHYAVAGTVYVVTPNLQLDMRVGEGLNHQSNDFLAGVGFAARY